MGTHRGQTIAVDFDGVLHTYSQGWLDGTIYDLPVEGAQDAIYKLKQKGYRVIVLTARQATEDIREWMDKHMFPAVDDITNTKPPAIAYIDDRGIRFTNWTDMVNYF